MGSVKAGVPSPAEEVRGKMDLVQHSASTFFFRNDGSRPVSFYLEVID